MLDLLIANFSIGFAAALSPQNLGLCFAGALLGTLIGVLPGIGSVATIAMLLPITFGLPPTSAMIMLAGIYYGAHYGGSTTAILVNLPGEASSVITCLDGYAMARARPGRRGAGDLGDRFLRRRLLDHVRDRLLRTRTDRRDAMVRRARLFRADDPRSARRHRVSRSSMLKALIMLMTGFC